MLKNIHPLLDSDLLGHLQAMGHGDVIAIVDRNFPAASTANRLVSSVGTDVNQLATAVLTVLPVDAFVEPAVFRMGPVGAEDDVLDVHADFQRIVDTAEGRAVPIAVLERFDFYRQAAGAYVVVVTGEVRPYGCFLVTKGVIAAEPVAAGLTP